MTLTLDAPTNDAVDSDGQPEGFEEFDTTETPASRLAALLVQSYRYTPLFA
ncbi:MAG: hypothetical protein ACRDZ3_01150 [Acidimicrobiia bacterium]